MAELMTEWRPEEGWNNPWLLRASGDEREAYEAGADKIVVALKNDDESQHCNAGEWIETAAGDFGGPDGLKGIAGTWVFIPDKETP